jgi:hypothetical protein
MYYVSFNFKEKRDELCQRDLDDSAAAHSRSSSVALLQRQSYVVK